MTLRKRSTLPAAVALAVALLAAGCGDADRNVAEVPEPDTTTPNETPLIEPVSPPANEVERPDEEPGEEGGVPEDDDLGSEDGEETGAEESPPADDLDG